MNNGKNYTLSSWKDNLFQMYCRQAWIFNAL